jgi:hypothetical protein
MRYFLFPRKAAAYRIGQLIASAADEAAGGQDKAGTAGTGSEGFLKSVIQGATKGAPGSSLGYSEASPDSRVQPTAKKLFNLSKNDPKLFSLVMKELERRAV